LFYFRQFADKQKKASMDKAHCIHINAAKGTVERVDMPPTLEDLQGLVANPIALGMSLANGDVVYVDDEAEYRSPMARAFHIEGHRFLGNAVVVRIDPDSGEDLTPLSTAEDIAKSIQFGPITSTPSDAKATP
jgi:hypothetical protein